ncbi:MAG: nuclear transport factor 2 family protein [Maribacter sp.]|nr:nuclear transport factor 2 family protein [Maribacter sp.]
MKRSNTLKFIPILFLMAATFIGASAFSKAEGAMGGQQGSYEALYHEIARMDSIYFEAYNTCDMVKQAAIYADNVEFYHDQGGLSTSKKAILESIEKNICHKVTRELVPGSIEVYPIKDFGAVEIGLHKFHNSQEPDAVPKPSKFIVIWEQKDHNWLISRVISLH